MVLTTRSLVFLIRDFERVCRGETSLETSRTALNLSRAKCFYLAFEHGRVCVATVRAIYLVFLFLFSFISLTFLSNYFSVAWAFHIRSQQEPGRFDRLDKGRVRTTLRRPGAQVFARHQLYAAHRPSCLLYVGRCKTSGSPTVRGRARSFVTHGSIHVTG